MRTDEEIKSEAFHILFKKLGSLETERFISLIKRNNYDYTKWRVNLPKYNSIVELSNEAMKYRRSKNL